MTDTHDSAARHSVVRVRHEVRLRELAVRRVDHVTPQMLRVTLGGEALQGFISAAPDDHVKVFFPAPGSARPVLPTGPPGSASAAGPQPIARDYTPRRIDLQARELEIDFVLHGDGPAAQWAAQARVGQSLAIGGPRGSFVVSDDFDWYLLVGDETALPAIGRRLDELRADTQAQVIVEVADAAEQQSLQTRAALNVSWLHRDGASPGGVEPLLAAVRALTLPPGDGYVWIAGESHVAKALREHLLAERGLPKAWIKAAGYWKHDAVATHETHND
jgi:NADPH-dependent ferric siderophore reductase